jgi:hypothetical protein
MTVTLPLDRMNISEKLRVMEDVWDDLCHVQNDVPSPAWHGEILAEREQKVRSGLGIFIDLEEAKRRVRDQVQ